MSEYKDFVVGQRVSVNSYYGEFYGSNPHGIVVNIDPKGASWPIEVDMEDKDTWGDFPAPFDPKELDIVG